MKYTLWNKEKEYFLINILINKLLNNSLPWNIPLIFLSDNYGYFIIKILFNIDMSFTRNYSFCQGYKYGKQYTNVLHNNLIIMLIDSVP